MYDTVRRGLRVACDDKCFLVCHGQHFPCKLENISVSGVLLNSDAALSNMQPGDTCGLIMCSDPLQCPGEYRSKVVRLDAPKLALQFLDIKF